LNSSNVAGAEVRASMLIPSQFAEPSGTIAIAVGIAPEVCIIGKAVCLMVIIPLEPIAEAPDDMPVDAMLLLEVVVIVEAAAEAAGFELPLAA
jgi:hypothetical protein